MNEGRKELKEVIKTGNSHRPYSSLLPLSFSAFHSLLSDQCCLFTAFVVITRGSLLELFIAFICVIQLRLTGDALPDFLID